MKRYLFPAVMLFVFSALASTTSFGQTSTRDKRIETCVNLTLACQNPADGSFLENGAESLPEVNVDPYFAGFGTLGLLADYEASSQKSSERSKREIDAVQKWLRWCSQNTRTDRAYYKYDQDPNGALAAEQAEFLPSNIRYTNFLWRFVGPRGATSKMSLRFADSTDSYAALVLLNLGVLSRVQKTDLDKHLTLASKAVQAIQLCQKRYQGEKNDHLTVARPNYRIKYFLDNVEVIQGLKAAGSFFTEVQENSTSSTKRDSAAGLATLTSKMVKEMTADLSLFYVSKKNIYVDIVNMLGGQQAEATLPYDGLANLYGAAHITGLPLPKSLWNYSNKMRSSDSNPDARIVPTGRWLMAAYSVSPTTEKNEVDALLKEINVLNAVNNRVHYSGTALLALHGAANKALRLPEIPFTPAPAKQMDVAPVAPSGRVG